MTLDKKIDLCENLTPVEVRIGNYILTHKEQVMECTIQDLEKEVFVSKSAIHRFCKKIGLNGFNDLKVELAKEDKIETDNWVDVNVPFYEYDSTKDIAKKLMNLYELTIQDTYKCLDKKQLEEVARLIADSQYVDIYSIGHNENVADNFKQKMLGIGKIVNCPKSGYEQRLHSLIEGTKHVVLILSYSGDASWIKNIVQRLVDKKIPVVLISRVGLKGFDDTRLYHLYVSDSENLQNRISHFASHIAMQYIMDILFSIIYNMDREKNNRYIRESMAYER
jgi:DNA-binding MurR/RpiR family transcriptional regulator